MTMADVSLVAATYRQEYDTLTEKERASRERAIWAMTEGFRTAGVKRYDLLKNIVGQEIFTLRIRAEILAIGDAADVIWGRLDRKEILISTAGKLATQARRMMDGGTDSVAAVTEALREYDALPCVRVINGVPCRMDYPRRSPAGKPEEFPTLEVGKERDFWLNFRNSVMAYLDKKCEGVDASNREILKRDFEIDIKVVIDQFLSNARRVQLREKKNIDIVALSRNKVLESCEILHMDPPARVGGPVDMEKARIQKKQLARSYHPDSNGGDQSMKEQYQEVIQAFQTLEAYSKANGASK